MSTGLLSPAGRRTRRRAELSSIPRMSTHVGSRGTADGESETVLGKWFARSGRRSQVVLATKLGFEMGDGKKGFSSKYIAEAVEASLNRLQTDYIDLYQAHTDDTETPLEETLTAFDSAGEAGQGAGDRGFQLQRRTTETSNRNQREEQARTLRVPATELFAGGAHPLSRAICCPWSSSTDIGVIPYFSLAAGFLTGKYRSKQDAEGKARSKMVEKYLNDRGFAVLKALDAVAAELHSTPGERRSGMADRQARHHCADCQRHLARSTEGSCRSDAAQTSTGRPLQSWTQPAPQRKSQPERRRGVCAPLSTPRYG